MRILCLMVVVCGLAMTDIQSQSGPGIPSPKERYSVVLRSDVISIDVESITPSDIMLSVGLRLELLNVGARSILFLDSGSPELRSAALAKNPKDFSTFKHLVLEYFGESVDGSTKWAILRNDLNQPSPPLDKVRVLNPNEAWKWQSRIQIALPKSDKGNFSDHRESWENIKKLPNVWLRTVCQVWPLNLERQGSDRKHLEFGTKLQKRWKDSGLLWLEGIPSEPVALNLGSVIVKD